MARQTPPQFPLQIGAAQFVGIDCCVLFFSRTKVVFEWGESQPWPAEGRLVQNITACTAAELSHALLSFWQPLWNRDGRDDGVPNSHDFLSTLDACPLPALDLHLDSFVEELWIQAVRKLSPKKATGVCGWAPADLKLLPDKAVSQLRRIFRQASSCGLPAHLL